MSKTSLAEWLLRLESLHPSEIELGLDRVRAVADSLQLLPVSQPVISVAGTNGKGTTVAVMEAVLAEMGCLTGSCTSPHFLRFNERIRIAGEEVRDQEITSAFEQVDAARGAITLTYFEFATLAALVIFRARNVEVVLLEVGLGGRLDAVNIVDATVSIITSIDLDHQDWLGDSREVIAREKAGILRPGCAAVIAETNPPASLRECVDAVGCEAHFSGEDYFLKPDEWTWQANLRQLDGVPRLIPELRSGALLADNICAALQALLLIGKEFTDEQLLRALDGLQLRGRREVRHIAGLSYLLDVAHNPAAIDKLLKYISVRPCIGKNIALFSAMENKDIRAMTKACAGRFDAWFIAGQPSNPRAARASEIAELLHAQGNHMISVSKNIVQAFRRAQSVMSKGDRLVVFGSFNTVAAVLPLLEKDQAVDNS